VLGVFGTLTLIGIIWLLIWTFRQSRVVYLSVALLAALGAILNLTIGGLLGVLIETKLAGLDLPVGNVFVAHPGMMTAGYIVPAAQALAEWQLKSGVDGQRDWLGVVAVGLLVVAGWLAAIGLASGVTILLLLTTIFQIVAVVLFAIRLAPRVVRVPWLAPTGERLAAVTAIVMVIDVAMISYLIIRYAPTNFEGGTARVLRRTGPHRVRGDDDQRAIRDAGPGDAGAAGDCLAVGRPCAVLGHEYRLGRLRAG
jgi:hypothetical protein